MDERGWTLYKLAQESGIPYSSLNSLFNKNNQPTISTLEKIIDGFHISMSEFFSDRPPYREIRSYSDEELELLETYNRLNKKNKVLLTEFAKVMVSLDEKQSQPFDWLCPPKHITIYLDNSLIDGKFQPHLQ